jgi:hypothetical protein
MKIPKNKLVKIYWHDHGSNSAWQDIKDIKKWADESYINLCETIGECILETKDYIVINAEILPDKNTDDVIYGLKTMIVKKDIEKFEKL